MAGEALTNKFMLGSATVMIGPQADLMDLTPADHSLGLVKNFSVSGQPQFTDLRQGVKNQLVASVLTENTVRASMEVYEYTARNLAYALSLDGTDYPAPTVTSLVDASTAGSGAVVDVTAGDGANFTVGDHIMIDGGGDLVEVRKIASIETDALTVDVDILRVFLAGSVVSVVNSVDVGSTAEPDYFAMQVVGRAANNDPIVLLLPKVRITGGFTMAFGTDNFGNLPFEVTVFDKVSTDPLYANWVGRQAALIRA
jgi:hypothetical protein